MYWGTCVERADTSNMIKFIRWGIDLNKPLSSGDPPLHVCAKLGHIKASKILLTYGCSTNLKNQHGYTPIQLVSRYHGSSRQLLLLFMKFGCNPIEKNKYGKSALDYSRKYLGQDIILSYICGQKWRFWAHNRRLSRERQFAKIVWKTYNISCELEEILKFI